MLKTLLTALMMASAPALAGNEFGDGGHVVQCMPSSYGTQTVELLDFFEARVGRGVQLETFVAPMDVYEIISSRLRQIERLDPERARRYHWLFLNFSAEVRYPPTVPLTPDLGELAVTLPAYCQLNQAIVRRLRPDGLPYYEIGFIFRGLKPMHRAGLIMHEIIYADAKAQHGIEDAHGVREFNAYVFSTAFETTTPEIYAEMLRRLETGEP